MTSKLNLAKLNIALGSGRVLYYKDEIAWAMRSRGKEIRDCLTSNVLTQLGQSQHTSSMLKCSVGGGGTTGIGNMFKTFLGLGDAIPSRHADWIAEEVKAKKADVGARIMLDVLFSRILPGAIQSISAYALAESTSKTDLLAVCKERFGGEIGPNAAKLVSAMHDFVEVATEKGQDTVKSRATTAVSLQSIQAAATSRKKRKAKKGEKRPAAQV